MVVENVLGWKATPPEVMRLRQYINSDTLCRKLNTLSRETLPIGAGDVFASVDSGLIGIWYSPSYVEREFVRYNTLLLFKVREENNGITCVQVIDPRIDELAYLPEKLMPKLIHFFTELKWAVNSC